MPYISIVGIMVLLGLAYLLSGDKKNINLRVVGSAFLLQLAVAAFVLVVPFGKDMLTAMSNGVNQVINYSNVGIEFLFGGLADMDNVGFVFVVKVLPIIIFASALMSVLYYLHIMQWVVKIFGGALHKIIGTKRVESLCAAANIFLGQTEAPLVVRPYLGRISDAQFFTVMVSGLASISGTILAGYAALGVEMQYLIAASFMAAPGGLLMAKIIMPDPDPEENETEILDVDSFDDAHKPANVIEAAANGAADGLKLAANIGAMLLAFVALIAMLNGMLGGIGGWFDYPELTFNLILGKIFAPLMYVLGIPWAEADIAGNLIGTKLILNEFVGYVELAKLPDGALSPYSVMVVTFALCGFANLSSIAILMGGFGVLVPERRHLIAKWGLKAVAAGSLSNLMSAALAGLLIGF
ncbi:NupC/NupG family nucleoside CNT transporter [Paremcibacter congregatus]|uniref:Nucleoside permease n=1 Tax=Paremcibacter congregatus TaxID=2043170 RepID=A0A2G4YTA4_9PROT|nr:NupC/NupG family nucleoside CNT transporter [Paremcibacter congregatus]PHZ85558.1 NupC/NupG family nucleoside CNT transporter [Paremcibacter congregatus]QDE26518.1 NupC/NupG family nucleoside CNT transporter [Paremcibacter congregatus]